MVLFFESSAEHGVSYALLAFEVVFGSIWSEREAMFRTAQKVFLLALLQSLDSLSVEMYPETAFIL